MLQSDDMSQIPPGGATYDVARVESMYMDALRARDWAIGIAVENGRLRWELEQVIRDFNSAVVDVNYHMERADDLAQKVSRMETSNAWKLGRALTSVPRRLRGALRESA